MSWWTGATHGTRIGRYVFNSTIGAWRRWTSSPDPDDAVGLVEGALLSWNATNEEVQSLGVTATTGTDTPTGTTRININGHVHATKIFNAVWNDIVDFIDTKEVLPVVHYGRAYCRLRDGRHVVSSAYMPGGLLGIASDTYGFGVGHKSNIETTQLPIAIGGVVLAYVDQEYETGTPLTATEGGDLTEMREEDRAVHPERIIATYYRPETDAEWNGISVNGRHWVKVR